MGAGRTLVLAEEHRQVNIGARQYCQGILETVLPSLRPHSDPVRIP